MKRRVIWAAILGWSIVVGPASSARAQAPGYAEITSPGEAQALEGLVSIEGSADHPSFVRYDLAFAHDPNPTDTWFPIGEPVSTRARQAVLGLWDTSPLTPGIYQLRLRVFLEGGAFLEDIAGGLRVGLPSGPAPASVGTAPSPAPTLAPTVTPTPAPAPPAAAREGDPVLLALGIGGFTAAAFLVILAAYLPLRRGLALWAGSLRMRRVLRQDAQRQRSRRSRR